MVACLVEKQRTTPDQYPLTLNSFGEGENLSHHVRPPMGTSLNRIQRILRLGFQRHGQLYRSLPERP